MFHIIRNVKLATQYRVHKRRHGKRELRFTAVALPHVGRSRPPRRPGSPAAQLLILGGPGLLLALLGGIAIQFPGDGARLAGAFGVIPALLIAVRALTAVVPWRVRVAAFTLTLPYPLLYLLWCLGLL